MNSKNYKHVTDLTHFKRLFEQDVQTLFEFIYTDVPVKERHIRLASVIVRRWLCDNELRHLSRPLKSTVTFPVLDDKYIFENVTDDLEIDYYLSAGVKFNGEPLWALYHSSVDEVPEWAHQLVKPAIKLETLADAMKRPVLYFEGETFKMEEVLRFACNKLGGAHFDTSRKNVRQRKMDAAEQYLTFGPPIETLQDGRAGVIHLPLEPEGSEVLSGIAVAVAVIVGATMLVNIHFDGVPFIQIE